MITQFIIGLINDMFFAMIPAVGFALVFNVPVKALKYCAIGGAIGHGLRYLGLHIGFSLEWSTLIAATTVGFIGVHWSHRFLAHPKVFTVAAMIPMVPGVFAFKAMIALVQINSQEFNTELWAIFIDNSLTTMFTVGALAIGLAMPGLLFYRSRPVV